MTQDEDILPVRLSWSRFLTECLFHPLSTWADFKKGFAIGIRGGLTNSIQHGLSLREAAELEVNNELRRQRHGIDK